MKRYFNENKMDLDSKHDKPVELECEIDMINAYIESEGLDSISVETAAAYTLKRLEGL